ncbi:MAG: S-layer homology domain-containing protein, partial [Bacteroidales bacterium]|nr:S-layer homology domain-containing protein [Bacteroidales bacterium]
MIRGRSMKGNSKLKRGLCLIICMILVFPSAVFASSSPDYTGHWAEKDIANWVGKGYVKGFPDGTFRPDSDITRAEFMAIVNRGFELKEMEQADFKDIKASDWFYNDIAIAVKAGYIKGFVDNTMRPLDNISRQEAAIILARLLNIEEGADTKALKSFKDGAKVPSWSSKAMAAVAGKEYLKADVNGNIRADKPITRGEAISMLNLSYLRYSKVKYNKAGVFTGKTIDGSVEINNKDITLMDTVIEGDLILGQGIGEGNVHLINVAVKGDTLVKGGGINSIIIENCNFTKIIIIKENGKVRVVAVGNTKVDEVELKSGAKLEESKLTGEGFGYVVLAEGLEGDQVVELKGSFDKVEIKAEGITVQASGGTIGSLEVSKEATKTNITLAADSKVTNLVLDAAAKVDGKGTVATAKLNVSGSTINTTVTKIEKAPGVTVQTPAPTTSVPSTGGGQTGSSRDDDDDDHTPMVIPVTGIELDKSVVYMVYNETTKETLQLTATISPANATNKSVTWSVNEEGKEFATVSNTGLVTAVKVGSATVTATAIGSTSQKAAATVKVYATREAALEAEAADAVAVAENLANAPMDTREKIAIAKTAYDKANTLVTALYEGDAKTALTSKLAGINTAIEAAKTILDNIDAVAADKATLNIGDLSAVINNLTLPLSGSNGTTITWSSDTIAVIANDGTVTRPAYYETDKTVTLTATIKKGAASETKIFTATVLKKEKTEADAVAEINSATAETMGAKIAANATLLGLNLTDYNGLKDKTPVHNALLVKNFADKAAVKTAFDGATAAQKAAEEKAAAIKAAIDAINALPEASAIKIENKTAVADARGLVAAAKTKGAVDGDITNLAKLVACEAKIADLEAVAAAKAALTLGDTSAVTANITLPEDPSVTITWESSNTAVVANDGKVTRPTFTQGDVTVTLTATITKGSVSDTKAFTVKVIKLPQTVEEAVTQLNNATEANIKEAVENTVLGLNLTEYNKLAADEKTLVANQLIGKNFGDKVAVQDALDTAVTNLNDLKAVTSDKATLNIGDLSAV